MPAKFVTKKTDITTVTEVEMDEMHHFLKKNSKIVVLENYFSPRKKLIRWALGHSAHKTLIKMYDSMGLEEFPNIYSERYESYKEFFSKDNLIQSKKYTSPIERNNGRQRHRLVAFRRCSILLTRSLKNLAISIALFARFHINSSIDELIALLK